MSLLYFVTDTTDVRLINHHSQYLKSCCLLEVWRTNTLSDDVPIGATWDEIHFLWIHNFFQLLSHLSNLTHRFSVDKMFLCPGRWIPATSKCESVIQFNEIQWSPNNSHKKYMKNLCELSRMCKLSIHQSRLSKWGRHRGSCCTFADKFGVSNTALNWFKSYLQPRMFKVKVGEAYSSERSPTYSVPQGSCARANIFNLYCSPLGEINPPNLSLSSFTDDHSIRTEV